MPGSGKTTLAHRLARGIGCPAICRDEIREGIAQAGTPDPTKHRTLDAFFAVVALLLRAGVTVVAQAAVTPPRSPRSSSSRGGPQWMAPEPQLPILLR